MMGAKLLFPDVRPVPTPGFDAKLPMAGPASLFVPFATQEPTAGWSVPEKLSKEHGTISIFTHHI